MEQHLGMKKLTIEAKVVRMDKEALAKKNKKPV